MTSSILHPSQVGDHCAENSYLQLPQHAHHNYDLLLQASQQFQDNAKLSLLKQSHARGKLLLTEDDLLLGMNIDMHK